MYIVNKEQLSEVLGVTTRTLDKQLRRGMPFVSKPKLGTKNREWQFNTVDVIAWREEQKLAKYRVQNQKPKNMEEAKLRQAIAKAEMDELELDKLKKTLLPAAEIEIALNKMFSSFRNRMLAIPSKVAPFLREGIKDILEDEVHEALAELSADNVLP